MFVRDHLLYSTDFSRSDFHVIVPMKEELSKQLYYLDDEVKAATKEWLLGIGWDLFADGTIKLVLCLNKCITEVN